MLTPADRLRYRWRFLAITLVGVSVTLTVGPAAYADGSNQTQTVGVGYTLTGCPQNGTSVGCATAVAYATSGFQRFNARTTSGGQLYVDTTGSVSGITGTLCYVRRNLTTNVLTYIQFNNGFPTSGTLDDHSGGTTWERWYRISTSAATGTCASGNDPGTATEDAVVGTPTCSRSLTDTSAMTGSFTGTAPAGTYTTATGYDWNWGDSTTHGALLTNNHTYGALSTMPTGGWTATLTVTYTASTGHLFAGAVSTGTATCALRVDFLHPSLTTPASTGTDESTGDAGLDDCLPSGWSVLNPVAWVGGIGCVLKFLFIPDESTFTDLTGLWDEATDKAPFSVVTDLVTYIPGTLDDFKYALDNASPVAGVSHNIDESHSGSPLCRENNGGHLPNDAPLDVCEGSGYAFGNQSWRTNQDVVAARTIMLFLLVALFVYATWRGAAEILK